MFGICFRIVFVFHKNQPGHTKAKVKPPRLNGKRVGVFSTRSPYRPNPIGLTLAKIEKIAGNRLLYIRFYLAHIE
jgi:tRNA (Thr-GGU) A37 N-methylase